MVAGQDHYAVLGVEPVADFTALRKAYRARAMDCHPDRHGGSAAKTEEFKRLGEAFNVLSDPVARRDYDLERGTALDAEVLAEDREAILDTAVDDILEELIVGNTMPRGTSLQTIMLDLEQTDRFCLFREAKTYLFIGRVRDADLLFRRYLAAAPHNILAHYFLARCCVQTGRWAEAVRELKAALRIGAARRPPLHLARIRQELERVRRQRPGLAGAWTRLCSGAADGRGEEDDQDSACRELNRTINRLAAEPVRLPLRQRHLGEGDREDVR